MTQMRLQKFLSAAGVCSRRQGEVLIAQGEVSVNGGVVTIPGAQVDPALDLVTLNGTVVTLDEKPVYIALNKPVRYESTCKNERSRSRTLLDLVDIPQRIYPVGRLDKDSQGLILLTNDGRIHHLLSHPSFGHEKEYVVGVTKPIANKDLSVMAGGMSLAEFVTQPCRIKRIDLKTFSIVLTEGKNRQIRKMVAARNNDVRFLKRIRIGHIQLESLKSGLWRHLSPNELTVLLKKLGIPNTSVKVKAVS